MTSLKRKASSIGKAPAEKKAKVDSTITSFFGPPKNVPAASATTPGTRTGPGTGGSFDKAKWVETLTEEQRELLKLEIDTMHESWLALLKDDITIPKFLELKRFLKREAGAGRKIYPPEEDIYSWSVCPHGTETHTHTLLICCFAGHGTRPLTRSRS